LGEIDGLVAFGLPGTEGEGVAQALFGRRRWLESGHIEGDRQR
jgi:hypothetical protein